MQADIANNGQEYDKVYNCSDPAVLHYIAKIIRNKQKEYKIVPNHITHVVGMAYSSSLYVIDITEHRESEVDNNNTSVTTKENIPETEKNQNDEEETITEEEKEEGFSCFSFYGYKINVVPNEIGDFNDNILTGLKDDELAIVFRHCILFFKYEKSIEVDIKLLQNLDMYKFSVKQRLYQSIFQVHNNFCPIINPEEFENYLYRQIYKNIDKNFVLIDLLKEREQSVSIDGISHVMLSEMLGVLHLNPFIPILEALKIANIEYGNLPFDTFDKLLSIRRMKEKIVQNPLFRYLSDFPLMYYTYLCENHSISDYLYSYQRQKTCVEVGSDLVWYNNIYRPEFIPSSDLKEHVCNVDEKSIKNITVKPQIIRYLIVLGDEYFEDHFREYMGNYELNKTLLQRKMLAKKGKQFSMSNEQSNSENNNKESNVTYGNFKVIELDPTDNSSSESINSNIIVNNTAENSNNQHYSYELTPTETSGELPVQNKLMTNYKLSMSETETRSDLQESVGNELQTKRSPGDTVQIVSNASTTSPIIVRGDSSS